MIWNVRYNGVVMTGIHEEIINRLRDRMQVVMIDNLDEKDDTRAGVVVIGPLQGDPDPDEARISISIHENDPDAFISGAPTTQDRRWWDDDVIDLEIGGVITKTRRFVIKARCLLERTRENLVDARRIASTVRTRIEHSLASVDFSGIDADGEYVSRGIASKDIYSEMLQGGGPPDSFEFIIKVQISVLTTTKP